LALDKTLRFLCFLGVINPKALGSYREQKENEDSDPIHVNQGQPRQTATRRTVVSRANHGWSKTRFIGPVARRTVWSTALLCGLTLACTCRGAARLLSAPAALFPASEATLTNGLRILILEDHHCPIVAVQVWYHVGSVNEPEGRRGFAHLFEHMMFRGTDRLGPTDHMDLIKSVGGDGNAFTSFDETCYQETLPAQQLELALWLESERMAFLTVDGIGLTTERKVVEEELRMNLNQPYGDLPDQGLPAIFGKHPYANSPIGTIRDLRQATPSDLHAWWTTWYTPNNATLVVVGDVEPDRVRALAGSYFGWVPAVPQTARTIAAVGPFDAPTQIVLKLENAPAPGVGVVWRTVPEGHPDGLALELVATILGGGESSRLYRRLVAEDHLAVTAMAVALGLERGGVFGAGAVLSPLGGDAVKTLAAVNAELERLRTEGVTEEELEKARNQAVSRLVLGAETVGGKAQLIGRAAVIGAGVDELNARLERLRRLNREDLQRIARLHLDPQRAITANVPGSGLLGQLGRLVLGNRKAEEEAPVAFAPEALLRGRPGVVRPRNLPARPPVSEGDASVPNPTVHEHRLTNGLRVLIVPDAKTPAVRVVLALPFGSWAEEKPGAAAMALTMVSKGTETHDEKSLAEELERYAIQMSGFADYDDSRIEVTSLSEHAERSFSLMAEAATRPTFPESALKTAVTQAMTDLMIADSNPGSVADREFRRHFFNGHPYARRLSGESADLNSICLEDLAAFWRRVSRPDRATLIVAGSLTHERALALSERFFSGWKAVESAPIAEPAAPPDPGPTRILLVDWPGATQSEIRIGGRGLVYRDPDRPIASLVSSYFGASYGSRLMKAIRIEKGSTYGAQGGFRANRLAGTFEVSTFTKTPSTGETLRVVLAEIRGLLERPPASGELSLHRRYFLGSAAARFETSGQVADQLARITMNGLPLDHVQHTFAIIGAADASQCQTLARRLVDPEHLLLVVVGDAARIADDLRAISPVTILDRGGKEKK
jgi:zinc protease